MMIDFRNWDLEIKILMGNQIPQPGLSGAHFFCVEKSLAKNSGNGGRK